MRILILMASAGGGHRSVSMALKDALLRTAARGSDVLIADLLAFSRPGLVDQAVRLYGPCIRIAPAVYGSVYHFTEHPLVYPALRASTNYTFAGGIKQLVRDQAPSAVVSTYPLGNRALLDALDDLGVTIPAVAVVTELVSLHPSWAEPGFDRWAVATPEARQTLIRLGVPPDHISILGLPVNERFGHVAESPEELRMGLGLERGRPTVLVVGGAEGAGRLGRLVPAIAGANPGCQLIVVCGHNAAARRRLEAKRLDVPTAILGFVDRMPELMHAADIVVTKGGPQSIAEALASRRPVVVFDSLPGQEEGNAEYVERYGFGLDGRTTARAQRAVHRLLADPGARAAMSARAARLARPDAARATAQMVLSLAMAGAPVLGVGS